MFTYPSIIKFSWGLSLLITLFSCKKFVDIEPAPDLVNTDALFNSDATAQGAVNGVYVLMRETSPSIANGTLSAYCGLSADELNTTFPDLEYDVFEKNALQSASDVIISQIWTPAYRVIYRTNIIIEKLEKSRGISENLRKQLAGEMKLVRALHYFYLVNIHGDIPLAISSDYRENERKVRTLSDQVYQQIVKDLEDAITALNENYPSAGKLRPNKFSALALLARVYLYQKEWAKAEGLATQVISSGKYSLVVTIQDVFKKNSAETIWEIASPRELNNTVEGSLFIPSSANSTPTFLLSSSLLSAFEQNDQRKLDWVGQNNVGGINYYYPYKFKAPPFTSISEYEIVFRLAELYLIRAEARAEQNQLANAKADLNIIRSRASLPLSQAIDQAALLNAIQQERRVELFAEWGHRWFDLKRTNQVDNVLSATKGADWQNTDALFPIPFSETELNPSLTQNPGY